jgi:LexA-binding, inner membrane-associated putative hydrolase
MFIGHFAVGFASKRLAPQSSLVPLLVAPLLADLLWPVFLPLGWEHARIDPGNTRFSPLDLYDYPLSHGLLPLVVWATLFAVIYWGLTRYLAGAAVIWFGVLSHWVLDWITHRPDMPLYPGSPKYGLGLWNSIAGTMVVELAMLAGGLWLYIRTTQARDRIGRYGFAAYVLVLLVLYIGDPFSDPPPSVKALIWTAIVFEPLFLIWAWWFDRHRELRGNLNI